MTFKNYKEPLDAIPKTRGHGFYGVLLSTTDGQSLQCHQCGNLYASLPNHIVQTHKISTLDYRSTYELARSTALVSEAVRTQRKLKTLTWLKTLTEEEINEYRSIGGKKGGRHNGKQPKLALETYNKRGSCPSQLLEKILEIKRKLKKVPTLHEFIAETDSQRYKHLIFKVFGSWKKALKMLNLTPVEPQDGGFKKYSNEELLEYLNIFAQENRKIPTATDFRRGLLPSYNVYTRRFGNIENARQEAGVYQFVEK